MRLMKVFLILTISLVFGILFLGTSFAADTPLTTNTADQNDPAISVNKVVWEDNRYGNSDIYMKDLSTNTETRLTSNTAAQENPDIYGNKVVWQDNRYGNWDIYMKNLATNVETRLTTNTADQKNPSIYNNIVVWEDNRYGNWDIFMKDLSTNVESRFTTNSAWQGNPDIYGTRVVWQDNRYGQNDIFMKYIGTSNEIRVTSNSASQTNPNTYSSKIVWQDNRYGNWDIYMRDLSTNTESRLTTNSANQMSPVIYGDRVLWQDSRYVHWDVFMKNLSTSVETRLTTNTATQITPAIYGDKVIWEDHRRGNWDIYRNTDYNTNPPASPVKLIFIHHSCGGNWLSDSNGGLGIALRDNNYFVSDTNYGWGPDGIGSSTDTGDWPTWFIGPNSNTYMSALYSESEQNSGYSRLATDPGGENEIIMFKSCYPCSEVGGGIDDEKAIYNSLKTYFTAHPEKMFVLITPPGETNVESYVLTRELCNWLVDKEAGWLAGYTGKNVFVFDFYGVLSEVNSHHRYVSGNMEYVYDAGYDGKSPYHDGDNHPNAVGNQKATSEFLPLLNIAYNQWKA